MSQSQGNSKKIRSQKHQNCVKFNNLRHETNKREIKIASTTFKDVCQRCRDILEWKVNYKKYKVMPQAKTWLVFILALLF